MAKGKIKNVNGGINSGGSSPVNGNGFSDGGTELNRMVLNGKKNSPRDELLEIGLSDDYQNVAGFGQPITEEYARKMVKDYCDDVLAAQRFIKSIEEQFGKNKDFKKLKSLLREDRHIVSGVFGKEIILQILAQPKCEGIRYMFGKYDSKTTIILKGVTEVEEGTTRNVPNPVPAKSKPLEFSRVHAERLTETASRVLLGINGEVHKSSLTVSQIMNSISPAPEEMKAAESKKRNGVANAAAVSRSTSANGTKPTSANQLAEFIFGEY